MLISIFLSVQSLAVGQGVGPSTVDLSSSGGGLCAWTISSAPNAANDSRPALNLTATVPGDLTDDLVAAGVLTDPWAAAADPAANLTWAWKRRWTWRCAFAPPPAPSPVRAAG